MPTTRRSRTDTQSVTSAPESRTEDQARRLRRYLLTMTIRTVCFVLVVLIGQLVAVGVRRRGGVPGPFIAVVAANAVRPSVRGRLRPVVPTVDRTRQLSDRSWEQPIEGRHDASH